MLNEAPPAHTPIPPRPPLLRVPQALGSALEDHLHLLLPSLMRLVSPAAPGTPLDVRRTVLRSLKRLLPRMRLAGFGAALLHPLVKVWRGECLNGGGLVGSEVDSRGRVWMGHGGAGGARGVEQGPLRGGGE